MAYKDPERKKAWAKGAKRLEYRRVYYQKNRQAALENTRCWRQQHPDEVRSRAHEYYLQHLEEAKVASKARYWSNREESLGQSHRWYQQHAAELKKWREYHPDLVRARYQAWSQSHPEHVQALHARRLAVQRGSSGEFTKQQWSEMKKRWSNCCAYCLREMKSLAMDHVIPISKGGMHTAENIVPACRSCNSSKGAKMLSDFLSWRSKVGASV